MVVLGVLLISMLVFRTLGAAGLDLWSTWQDSARWALAATLLVTASAHFTTMRRDLVAMVPRWMPRPEAVVLLTGVAEICVAIGLLLPPARQVAGGALIVLLIAMFPANVHAARAGVTLRGRPPTPLWFRAPLQLGLIVWAWWVSR
jgi:uncharacterized membrane protein